MASIFLQKAMYGHEFMGELSGWQDMRSDRTHSEWLNKTTGASRMAIAPSAAVYEAFRLYAAIEGGTEASATAGYGISRNEALVAEIQWKDVDANNFVDVCAITNRGIMYATRIQRDTGLSTRYQIGDSSKKENANGAVFFLALMTEILKDEEAQRTYEAHRQYFLKSPEDATLKDNNFYNALNILTENIYYRFVYDGDLKKENYRLVGPTANSGGKVSTLNQPTIKSGIYLPAIEAHGTFLILATAGNTTKAVVSKEDLESYQSAMSLGRVLTEEEEKLVPKLQPGWILDEETDRLCRYVKNTVDTPERMRNFMLSGPSGTGKTTVAEMAAYCLHLPKVTITCNANTEIFDFTSQVIPVDVNNTVQSMDGVNLYDAQGNLNVTGLCKEFNYPSIGDLHWDPDGSYKRLTGDDLEEEMTEQDLFYLLFSKIFERIKPLISGGSSGFRIQESPFIQAIENGWIVEVQEPTAIVQQGVLVGLNSLMETEGAITLPNGRVIRRHPDAVVILTTNMDYFGCDMLNQSVISRMDAKFTKNNPPAEIMAKRAMGRTGYTDEAYALEMANLVYNIAEHCRRNGINDGVCDQRSLNAWMLSVKVDGKEHAARNLENCVLEKATMDKEAQEEIRDSIVNATIFAVE